MTLKEISDLKNKDFSIKVKDKTEKLSLDIKAKIGFLTGDEVEPERKKGESGSYIYNEGERPNETFVVYILEKIILENLAKKFDKNPSSLHIHKNVNTEGNVICWPQKLESTGEVKDMVKMWAGLVGALFLSDKSDINDFFSDSTPEEVIKNYGIKVNIDGI